MNDDTNEGNYDGESRQSESTDASNLQNPPAIEPVQRKQAPPSLDEGNYNGESRQSESRDASNLQDPPAIEPVQRKRATLSLDEQLELAELRIKAARASGARLRRDIKKRDYRRMADVGCELNLITGRNMCAEDLKNAELRRQIKALFEQWNRDK